MFSYLRYFHERGDTVTVIVSKIDPNVSLPAGVQLRRIDLSWVPKWLRAPLFNARLGRIVQRETFDLVLSMGRTTHHHAMIVGGVHRAYVQARHRKFLLPTDYLQMWMDRRAYRAPGVLLAASEMIQEQMVRYSGADPKKIHVLYPPTDPERFRPEWKQQSAELRTEFGIPKAAFVLVLLSANNRLKGVPLLLKVMAEIEPGTPPIKLYVAGPEPVNSDSPHVHYLGYVRESHKLLAAADLMVLPSEYDAFGQVVTESLFCGTPVVVSSMVGAQAILTDQEGIVVDSFAVSAWKNALQEARRRQFVIDRAAVAARGLRFEDHMQDLLQAAGKSAG